MVARRKYVFDYPEYRDYLEESRVINVIRTCFLTIAMAGLVALLLVLL